MRPEAYGRGGQAEAELRVPTEALEMAPKKVRKAAYDASLEDV